MRPRGEVAWSGYALGSEAGWGRWRESGVAPDQIIAVHVTNNRDMTRPLCPYPQVAHYTGVGSTNDAANFVCQAPPVPAPTIPR